MAEMNVKIKKTVKGVETVNIDQNMPKEEVAAFIAPYESIVVDAENPLGSVQIDIKVKPI